MHRCRREGFTKECGAKCWKGYVVSVGNGIGGIYSKRWGLTFVSKTDLECIVM